ncbi:MAG TPA: AzlC family ABC transporter permease [Pelagibacterium sp.]|uniref:AzlC family ABC transporter permease n=1 Tax=Pelagibacterium sp. TaxID=1967288 RepID=UPI002BE6D57A|nr:AzlC family ABC transporter permease [Pelagibacterium sp.]HWJ88312.1 AzlC family ABC transporter permease [Pelagibacterium sp.]
MTATLTAPKDSFRAGAAASLAITLGYFPVGVAFGIAAERAGLSALEAGFLSAVIYAGASQFLVLALLGTGAPLLVTALSIMATNLRHVLYGPAILEKARDRAASRHAWGWAGWLSDGAFGATIVALDKSREHFSERFMFGIGLGPYVSWVLGTLAGAVFGGAVSGYPALDAALGFLMPALFLAMLLALLSRRTLGVVIITALVTAPLILLVSPTVGIVGGMVAGALSGLIRWEGKFR